MDQSSLTCCRGGRTVQLCPVILGVPDGARRSSGGKDKLMSGTRGGFAVIMDGGKKWTAARLRMWKELERDKILCVKE